MTYNQGTIAVVDDDADQELTFDQFNADSDSSVRSLCPWLCGVLCGTAACVPCAVGWMLPSVAQQRPHGRVVSSSVLAAVPRCCVLHSLRTCTRRACRGACCGRQTRPLHRNFCYRGALTLARCVRLHPRRWPIYHAHQRCPIDMQHPTEI